MAGDRAAFPDSGLNRGRVSPVLPWIVGVTLFMQSMDGSILNNAIPSMAAVLQVNPLRMRQAVVAYLLTSALFVPVSGWLADRFGIRRIFSLAIVLFSLGSAACALSPSLNILIGSRVLQGIGGALMVPVGRLAVVKIYGQSPDLIRALGFISIPAVLGPVCGPLAGGFLVQYASWHWIFLINIPVGLAAFGLSLKYVPVLKEPGGGRFDFWGFFIFSVSAAGLSLWLTAAPSLTLLQNLGIPLLGLLLMAYYWLGPAGRPGAIFDRAIFKKKGFLAGILGSICSRTGTGAMPFLLPMFLQLGLGFSPLRAGTFLLAQASGSFLGKRLIAAWLPRTGFKKFLHANTITLGLAVFCFAFLSAQSSEYLLLAVLFLFGTVNSMQFTAMNTFILIDLEHREAAAGNSLLAVVQKLCSNSGVALAGSLMSLFAFLDSGGGLESQIPAREVFQKTFFVIGLVIMGASLVMRRLPRKSKALRGQNKVDLDN
jgi:EmrB/QacA subfamily drug resistance transporter